MLKRILRMMMRLEVQYLTFWNPPTKDEDTPNHHRRTSSASSDDGKCLNSDNFDDAEHFDDDIDKSPQGKRKALIRRFGDLLRRKKISPTQGSIAKDLPQPQKEITV